jgi:hypothetical protein
VGAAAIGAVGAIGSAVLGNKAAKKQAKAQREAMQQLSTELSPFSFVGPGGISGGFSVGGSGRPTPQHFQVSGLGLADGLRTALDLVNQARGQPAVAAGGNQVFGDLGALNPAFLGLVGLAEQGIGSAAAGGGMPAALAQALAATGTPIQVGQDNTLDLISQGLGGQFGAQLAGIEGLMSGGFQRGLQDTAFGGALAQAAAAGTGFQDVADNTLSLLREQAQPFESRAFQDLQENLFSTGRLGTSGGALQTEAFARGLAQADIGRQLQAQEEARRVQTQALQQATGLAGIGTGVRGLEDELLQSAFGRFAQTAGLAADVTGQRFQQNLANAGLGIQQRQDFFGNVLQSLPVGQALRQADLDFALRALQGQGALFEQSMLPFQAALAAAQAKANAEIGAGSNIASLAGSKNFSPGAGNELLANVFGNVAKHREGIADFFGGLFGGGE